MAFPSYDLKEVPVTDAMEAAIGARPLAAYMARDLLCVMDSEDFVRKASPDLSKVAELPGLLLHITAAGKAYDCVSRSFAPKLEVPEDPVCGSGHCHIFPYWAKVLGKKELLGWQASARGGAVYGRMEGDQVILGGEAVLSRKRKSIRKETERQRGAEGSPFLCSKFSGREAGALCYNTDRKSISRRDDL